jgi:hypothetical protein
MREPYWVVVWELKEVLKGGIIAVSVSVSCFVDEVD